MGAVPTPVTHQECRLQVFCNQCKQQLRPDIAVPHHWNPLRPIVCPLTLKLAFRPRARGTAQALLSSF